MCLFQILAPQEHQPRVRGWLLAAKSDKIGYIVYRRFLRFINVLFIADWSPLITWMCWVETVQYQRIGSY